MKSFFISAITLSLSTLGYVGHGSAQVPEAAKRSGGNDTIRCELLDDNYRPVSSYFIIRYEADEKEGGVIYDVHRTLLEVGGAPLRAAFREMGLVEGQSESAMNRRVFENRHLDDAIGDWTLKGKVRDGRPVRIAPFSPSRWDRVVAWASGQYDENNAKEFLERARTKYERTVEVAQLKRSSFGQSTPSKILRLICFLQR